MNTTYGTPAGGYGSDPADPPPADGFPARARKKRWFRWGAGITLASFLAGGGIALAVVSGGSTAAPTLALSNSGSTQASELNTELSAAAGNSVTATAPRVRWALGRLRRLGGVHGEFTFHNKTGFHTVAFERGTIQLVSDSDVVIKAPDGTTWTWQIVSDTVVRKNGAKTTASALSAGETVFAGGPEVSGAKDARLIVIRPAAGSSGSSSSSSSSGSSGPSGSESAQTSLS